jgi:hypothetical protein
MPSYPDFQSIIQEVREKYQLSEVDPDGEKIKEVQFSTTGLLFEIVSLKRTTEVVTSEYH